MATKIKDDESISGLEIGPFCYKILQFADDTALVLKNVQSLKNCLDIIDKFYKCSGLKLNKTKTIVTALGDINLVNITNQLNEIALTLCNDSFKYLGIWFDNDEMIMEYKNFRHRLEKIRNLLKIWLQRDLSLKGKITVIKTLAVSQLIYPLSMLSAPQWVIDEANEMFYRFLWDCKPNKISTKTIEKQISEGGLNMINIDYMARALKATWVKKIYYDEGGKWTNIPKMYFTEISFNEMCNIRFYESDLPDNLPMYYRQCLIILNELKNQEPINKMEVLNESLWRNKHITINNGTFFYAEWYEKGIKTIEDILDEKNEFMMPENLQEMYGLDHLPFLEYYSLRHSVPITWRNMLTKDTDYNTMIDPGKLNIMLKDIMMPIDKCDNKTLYWQILENSNKTVSLAATRWKTEYNISDRDMSLIFCIAFRSVRDTKIQSLQYKILNNTYICRLRLFQWKVKPDKHCLYCDNVDNIEHHFYLCRDAVSFWDSLRGWWSTICENCSEINIMAVLLGYPRKSCHFTQSNYIILKAKWYIYRTKYREEKICFFDFLPELKRELIMEEIISKNRKEENKFQDEWNNILEAL
jgi:hypothetical protein